MEETGESEACTKNKNIDWISTLLQSEFFVPCAPHQELVKNSFCIDCNLSFCSRCATPHVLHRRLKIRRYVFNDVVRLREIQEFLDCSKIQTYKINGEKAVYLKPRPQNKNTKTSTQSKIDGATCAACQRRMRDNINSFCSIACKASMNIEELSRRSIAASTSPHKQASTETSTTEVESSISVAKSSREKKPRVKKGSRKRKRTPKRAPLS